MVQQGALRFSVGSSPFATPHELVELSVKAETFGLYGVCVADHPGVTPSPFVRLALAATATTRLRLIPYVLNCGVRDPLDIASDAATLDVISNGRLVLGLGAGHSPVEWTMTGRRYPSAGERVDRLGEVVDVVQRLLAGDVVTAVGQHVVLQEAFLMHPRPVQDRVPLLIGGNGPRLLHLAGEAADIVSFTGLGATLDDGHRHEALWDAVSIDARVSIVEETAPTRSPTRDVLVQHLEFTDDRVGAAARFVEQHPDLTTDVALSSPHVLIGTLDELTEELLGYRERWGFTSYVVPGIAIDAAAALAAAVTAL